MIDDKLLMESDPIVVILVTRGDELPKKNYETKLHPTYEITINIKDKNGKKITSPHQVVKFYDQYYDLHNELHEIGIGKGLSIDITEEFPPKLKKTGYGLKLTEEELQHRCYLLSKWVNAVFKQYFNFPTKAQILMSKFLSLDNNDESEEKNKELMLSILRKMKDQTTAEGIHAFTTKQQNDPHMSLTSQSSLILSQGNSTVTGKESANNSLRLTSNTLNQINNTSSTYTTSDISNAPRTNKTQSINGTRSQINISSTTNQSHYNRGETIVKNILCVHVTKGIELSKNPDKNGKQHQTYKTNIKMLPINELILDEQTRKNLDVVQYESQLQSVDITIAKHFSGYRQLKEDLELVQVFCTDTITEASSARNSGYKVIIVDSKFPPTLSKSSLGIQLNEEESQERLGLLNNWFGLLLTAFSILPRDGQGLVMNFLEISNDNDIRNVKSNHLVVVSILKGTYELPSLAIISNEEKTSKHTSSSSMFGFGKSKSKTSNKSAISSTSGAGEDEGIERTGGTTMYGQETFSSSTVSSLPSPPPPNSTHTGVTTSQISPVVNKDIQVDENFEYEDQEEGHEIIVGAYLAVWVVSGALLAKKQGESKTHNSYEINIRVLPLSEVLAYDRDQYDPLVYEHYLKHGPLRIAKSFNNYRDLKVALETYQIFSLEQKKSATELALKNSKNSSTSKVIVLEAPFPKTYTKSSLGIKLTDRQITQRVIQLNNWFGALLKVYTSIPVEAQNLIIELLKSHNDDTSDGEGLCTHYNRRDVVIVSMLSGTFKPVLKPLPNTNQSDNINQNSTNKNNNKSNGKQGPNATATNTGCACVMM